jgi:hypothetical protein
VAPACTERRHERRHRFAAPRLNRCYVDSTLFAEISTLKCSVRSASGHDFKVGSEGSSVPSTSYPIRTKQPRKGIGHPLRRVEKVREMRSASRPGPRFHRRCCGVSRSLGALPIAPRECLSSQLTCGPRPGRVVLVTLALRPVPSNMRDSGCIARGHRELGPIVTFTLLCPPNDLTPRTLPGQPNPSSAVKTAHLRRWRPV